MIDLFDLYTNCKRCLIKIPSCQRFCRKCAEEIDFDEIKKEFRFKLNKFTEDNDERKNE